MTANRVTTHKASGGGVEQTELAPVATLTRRDGVMVAIRRAIVSGALLPGQKLTESRLAATLQVSRPTMREALAQLVQEGLLVQEPYRGLRVTDIDAVTIMDAARTRMALDTLAVRDILDDKSGRRLELVEWAWSEYERLPLNADPVAAHEAHVDFHRRIWEASENTMLRRFWPTTEAQLTILLARDQETRHDLRRARDMHEAVVMAIRSHDMRQVRKALEVHTLESARDFVALLDRESTA